jgi:hypothetical protein
MFYYLCFEKLSWNSKNPLRWFYLFCLLSNEERLQLLVISRFSLKLTDLSFFPLEALKYSMSFFHGSLDFIFNVVTTECEGNY